MHGLSSLTFLHCWRMRANAPFSVLSDFRGLGDCDIFLTILLLSFNVVTSIPRAIPLGDDPKGVSDCSGFGERDVLCTILSLSFNVVLSFKIVTIPRARLLGDDPKGVFLSFLVSGERHSKVIWFVSI